MKLQLDIQEGKAAFILELLANFKFVKAQPLEDSKAGFLEGLKNAVEEVQHIKSGQKSAKTLEAFLDEL